MTDNNSNINNDTKFGMQHILWILATFFFVYQYGVRSAVPSVLNEDLQKYFLIDATKMGGLVSMFFLAYTAMQIPVGLIIDRFSSRKILILACLGVALGELCFVSTNTYWVAVIGQIILGIGCSFGFVLAMKVSNDYFPKEQVAIISSISISAGSLGPVIASPLLAKLSITFPWKSVVIAFGLFGVILSTLCAVIIREKFLPKIETNNEPIQRSNCGIWSIVKEILLNKQYIGLSVFSMLSLAALSAFCDTWGLTFLRHSYDFSTEEASILVPITYAGTIVGGPIAALLAKQFSSFKKVMLYETIVLAILYTILVFVHMSKVELIILLFSLGVIGSCQFLVFPAALCCASKNIGATVTGVVNMITMLGVTIMSYLVGLALDWSRNYSGGIEYSLQDYRNSFILLIACVVVSWIVLFFTKDVYPVEHKNGVTK